jgi:hypothetical protein
MITLIVKQGMDNSVLIDKDYFSNIFGYENKKTDEIIKHQNIPFKFGESSGID